MDRSRPQAEGGSRPASTNEAEPRVSSVSIRNAQVFVLGFALPETRYPDGTTDAERDVIDLLLDGNTVKEVAARRGTSVRTVTTQLAEIYRKAGVRSLRQLAAFATGTDGPWTP